MDTLLSHCRALLLPITVSYISKNDLSKTQKYSILHTYQNVIDIKVEIYPVIVKVGRQYPPFNTLH